MNSTRINIFINLMGEEVEGSYEGETFNKLPHGEGEINFKNHGIYKGSFRKGEITGYGELSIPEMELIIKGDFQDGKLFGKGEWIYNNGDIIKGNFKNNNLNGWGKTFIDGGLIEGDWIDGEPTGKHTVISKNGKKYIGGIKNKLYEGESILFDTNGRKKFEGKFHQGKPHGEGKLWMIDGKIIEGVWNNGEITDKVKCYNKDGIQIDIKDFSKGNIEFLSEDTINDEKDDNNLLYKKFTILPITLLVIAILPLPYEYYHILRIVVFVSSLIILINEYKIKEEINKIVICFSIIGILYNPLLPVYLNKVIWIPINIISSFLFYNYFKRLNYPIKNIFD